VQQNATTLGSQQSLAINLNAVLESCMGGWAWRRHYRLHGNESDIAGVPWGQKQVLGDSHIWM